MTHQMFHYINQWERLAWQRGVIMCRGVNLTFHLQYVMRDIRKQGSRIKASSRRLPSLMSRPRCRETKQWGNNRKSPLSFNLQQALMCCNVPRCKCDDRCVCVCVRLLPVVRQRVITHRGYTSVVNTNVAAPLNYRRIWGIIIHSVFIFVSCKNLILMRLGNTQYNNIFLGWYDAVWVVICENRWILTWLVLIN